MSLFTQTLNFLSQLPILCTWPELLAFLAHGAENQPDDWHLPILACKAVGGTSTTAVPAVASLAALQGSIILIDDMLDADQRGYHHRLGMPVAANFATGLQAAGLEAITQANLSIGTRLEILSALTQMIGQIGYGQQLDCQNPMDEVGYWQTVKAKSAPFFGTAMYIGALCGGADTELATAIRTFGTLYGVIVQIHDDLNDTMTTPAGPDWLMGRSTLPILFALNTPHPERERFIQLSAQASNLDALHAAQEILLRCGAVSYAVDQIIVRYREAEMLLKNLSLSRPDALTPLLTAIINPVWQLIDAVGGEPGAFIGHPHQEIDTGMDAVK